MKYSGEERMSSGQRLLEEVQTHLNEAKTRWASLYPPDLYSVTHYTHYATDVQRVKQRLIEQEDY